MYRFNARKTIMCTSKTNKRKYPNHDINLILAIVFPKSKLGKGRNIPLFPSLFSLVKNIHFYLIQFLYYFLLSNLVIKLLCVLAKPTKENIPIMI
jgi:hypothetical protein